MSATEWMASESIALELVTKNAMNFMTAIPALARTAAMIARFESPCPLILR